MSNVFGSCKDKHTLWEEGVDENDNPQVTFESNVDGQEPVSLCLNPVKGATLNGEPVTVEAGLLILEDMFGSGVVSTDGSTYTITLPGQAPVQICLDPVKGVQTVDADGNVIVAAVGPDAAGTDSAVGSTATPSADGTQHILLTSDGVETAVCLNPAKSTVQDPATGVITTTYADGTTDTSDTKYSTTVPAPEGFHTITTDDGVTTAVCLTPLKSINGVTGDINGNVNVADLFSNTVDNGDGTYTTTNSDSTTVTWSGDTFATQMDNGNGTVTFTMADGSTVTLCLNPVKSVVQTADGLGATVTYADGTTGTLAYPASTSVTDAEAGTTTTTHPDGTTHTSCDNPVKDVVDDLGNSVVEGGVATLPCHPAEYVGEVICNEDANGVSCLGVQTHVVYDGTTCQPIRKYSQCSDSQSLQAIGGINGTAVYGSFTVLDPAQIAAGDLVEFTSELNFTLPKESDVDFEALWSLTGRNARVLALFEFSLDDGVWQPCSGGSNDDLVFTEYGTPGEIYSPEQCALRNLAKGAHNLKFRLRMTADARENTPLGDAFIVRFLNAAHFKVRYSQDRCTVVTL